MTGGKHMQIRINRGFRAQLSQYLDVSLPITVRLSIQGQTQYDICCFGVDASQVLSDDRYMVFYNQPFSPQREIQMQPSATGEIYTIALQQLPQTIQKLVFAVCVDGNGSMHDITDGSMELLQNDDIIFEFPIKGSDFEQQKSIIFVELYRKDGWKLAAIANGFHGGLADLLHFFGGEAVEDSVETPAEPVIPEPEKPVVSLEKKLEKAPALVSLAKPLTVELKKKNLMGVVAKVALVLDISGSMSTRYKNGTVQEIVNKTLPLAVCFDDDGELDFWYYGTTARRMPAVTMDNYKTAVPTEWKKLMRSIGGVNNEPAVMEEIIAEYQKSDVPAYVLFITDGGISKISPIKKLLRASSYLPIFWQFVGVGGSNYSILEKLDSLDGRYIDNANFFALDDFQSVQNEELYHRLLTEFPIWLKAAKEKGMIK